MHLLRHVTFYYVLRTQEQGIVTLSVDANFGLCRKKSVGTSVYKPLSGTRMFFNQEDVDKFISSYGSTSIGLSSVSIQVCYEHDGSNILIFYLLYSHN